MIRERGDRLEVVVYLGRDPEGRKRTVSRTVRGTGRAARRRAKQLEGELLEGRGRSQETLTLGQLLDRWREFSRLERSTAYQDRMVLDRHVRPVLGRVPIERLTAMELDEFYRSLERGRDGRAALAPATVRRIHNRLSSAFRLAMRWGLVAENPCAQASPPGTGWSEVAVPSQEAVLALLLALASDDELVDLATFTWVCASTGLRRGSACALRRSDVDLDAGELRTVRALGQAEGPAYVKTTKTGAVHALAIGETTAAVLGWHLERQDKTAAEFGATIAADAWLFSHDDDCEMPWRPDWTTKRLARFRAGHPELAPVTLRGLRRWMITEGLTGGVDLRTVSGRASHARGSTTLDFYSAFVPAADRDLAAFLERRLDG